MSHANARLTPKGRAILVYRVGSGQNLSFDAVILGVGLGREFTVDFPEAGPQSEAIVTA